MSLRYRKSAQHELKSSDEWSSVLKLAVRWQFDDTRDMAVEQLKLEQVACLIDQIILARQYDMWEWHKESSFKFCMGVECPTYEQGRKLGVDDSLVLSRTICGVKRFVITESRVRDRLESELELMRKSQ